MYIVCTENIHILTITKFPYRQLLFPDTVDVVDVCKKKIGACLACEYCHSKRHGECIQKDDMQEVYNLLKKAEMLVIA